MFLISFWILFQKSDNFVENIVVMNRKINFSEEQLESLGRLIKRIGEIGPSSENVEQNRKEAAEMSLDDLIIQMSKQHEVEYYVKSDNMFTRKARLLQSVKRHESGAKPGYVLRGDEKLYYGNLASDGINNNYNFLSDEIYDYAKYRADNKSRGETINKERLMCNFLSSQPMAFNLFYPLMQMLDEGKGEEIASVVSSFVDKGNKKGISKITEIGIEFIPSDYENYIGDRTAMDAYFVYETKNMKKGIIAVETKYTDVLGKNEANEDSREKQKQIITNELPYLFTDSLLKSIDKGDTKLTQLFRNFLLTEKVSMIDKYDDSISIVLAPKENFYNKSDEETLMNGLNDDYKYKFQTVDLESFVEKLIGAFPEKEIFKKFYNRYLDF